MKKLKPEKQKLVGKWLLKNNEIAGDETCNRIDQLVDSYLIELARGESGWDILFRDPDDNRYWELTCPQSEMHGGGPPTLTWIPEKDALKKYKIRDN